MTVRLNSIYTKPVTCSKDRTVPFAVTGHILLWQTQSLITLLISSNKPCSLQEVHSAHELPTHLHLPTPEKDPPSKHALKKYFAVPGPLVLPAVAVCGWCKLTPDLNPTLVGVTWFKLVLKYPNSPILHFQAILQIDLTWPLTLTCDFDLNLWLWPHKHVKVPGPYIISMNQV